MKKIFPYTLIAAFAVLSFVPSCKKSSDSSTCTCTGKSWNTQNDTTFTVPGATKGQCDTAQIVFEALSGDSTFTCKM